MPVPDEFIMVFAGFQTNLGNMNLVITIIVAAAGSFTGMNLSYFIGRQLDIHLVRKIKFFNIDKKLEKAEAWFARFGDKLIVAGYFFPGFRHFTAYFAGMSKFCYKRYIILVSQGAFIWTLTFIIIGRLLGDHWHHITMAIHHHLIMGAVILGIIVIIFYVYSSRKDGKIEQ